MKILSFSLVMMVLVANTYARSLAPKNDVPDPPKKVPARLPPAAVLSSAQAKFLARDKVPVPIQKKGKILVAPHVKSNEKPSHQPAAKAPVHVVAKMRSAKLIQTRVQAISKPVPRGHPPAVMKVPSTSQTNPKGNNLKPADSKGGLIYQKPGNKPNDGNITTTAPQPTTTTLDPWEEYCREACEAGMAGPECDCAGHPIGRRHAPLLEHGFVVVETRNQPMLQHHPHSVHASHPNL